MIYKKEEITKSYKKYLDAEKNQQDIFLEMRLAMAGFVELASFTGDAAESAKAYMEDIHVGILDTFGIALMDLEIRYLTLKQDFEATVDDSAVAILNAQFITEKKDLLPPFRASLDLNHTNAVNAVSNIKDDVYLEPLSYDKCLIGVNDLMSKTENVLSKMSEFNSRHRSDLSDLKNLFPLLEQALAYMESALNPSNIAYSREAAMDFSWLQGLSDFRILAFLYAREADPSLYETFYLAVLVNCGFDMLELMLDGDDIDVAIVLQWLRKGGDVLGVLGDITEGTANMIEVVGIFRTGLKFAVSTPTEGSVYIKVVSRTGQVLSTKERIAFLKRVGAPVPPGRDTIRKLFSSKGLCVWSNNRQYTKLFGNVDTLKEAKKLAKLIRRGNFKEAGNLVKLSKNLRILSGVGRALGAAGTVVTIGLDIADSFYDERTDSLSGDFDGARLAAGLTVDAGIIGASIAAGAIAGSFIPGPGNIIGAAVGAVVGLAIFFIGSKTFGEPKKSMIDHWKDGLTDAFESVGNWFSKVFW